MQEYPTFLSLLHQQISAHSEYCILLGTVHALSQMKSTFSDITWNVAGKTLYYAEYFMYYHVFLYISCYIAEIWIARNRILIWFKVPDRIRIRIITGSDTYFYKVIKTSFLGSRIRIRIRIISILICHTLCWTSEIF